MTTRLSVMGHVKNISIIIGVLMTLGSGIVATAYAAGWITDEAGVRRIAQDAVNLEEVDRLRFQLEYKHSELRQLNLIENPTANDEEQKLEVRKQIDAINQRIARLEGHNA